MNARPKRTAALYLAVVFLAGGAFGFAANQFYAVRIASAEAPRPALTASEYRLSLVDKLDAELTLDEDQIAEILIILDDVGERFIEIRDAMEPEFEAIRQDRGARIMETLSPQQRIVYGRILAERSRRREEKAAKRSGCN